MDFLPGTYSCSVPNATFKESLPIPVLVTAALLRILSSEFPRPRGNTREKAKPRLGPWTQKGFEFRFHVVIGIENPETLEPRLSRASESIEVSEECVGIRQRKANNEYVLRLLERA